MLDVGKLATLRSVVAHRSFSAAGQALSLTQPAVSRQVSELERQVGTQLVRRTRHGVYPTEAGRLLTEHAEVVLRQLALADEQLAELAGLRRGHIRLGSFFTALVYLSAEASAVLEERHPDLFRERSDVIEDQLVDRATAFARLASAELDVAIVFEHEFEPEPEPDAVALVALFDDPPRVLLPASHRLARRRQVAAADLADETWIRAHEGSAARLVEVVAQRAGVRPRLLRAGAGDEPVEAQALVASGRGVTIAHELNVILDATKIASRPLAGGWPVRRIQAAIMRDHRAPASRALLDALREVGRRRG
jgi:DNA-binding transcriptional LysR family regulator